MVKVGFPSLLAGTASFLLALPLAAQIINVSRCYPQADACTLGAGGCITAPTTLPSLESTASPTGDGYVRGTKCGADRAGKACGNYLGKAVCDDGVTACDCGGGMGPCTEAGSEAEELNLKATFTGNRPPGIPAPETPVILERLGKIATAGVPKELFEFWRGMASLDSLHLKAQIETWQAKGPDTKRDIWGAGTFESWETGGRYRYAAYLPVALGLSQIAEVAFDGNRFQMFLADSSLVTIGSTDSRIYSLPLRSPLSLVAHYLNPYNDETCGLCELRLSDLRTTVSSLVETPQSAQGSILRTPEAKYGSHLAVGYRLDYKPARRGVVSTLEQVTAKGQALTRVKLLNFNDVPGRPGLVFPWTIVYEILDDRGKQPILRHVYSIELLEVDKTIPDSVFNLTTVGGRHVWDDDHHLHVQ